MQHYLINWLNVIKDNTSEEFYRCTLRWLKDKQYFHKIKHNEDFKYTDAKNIVHNYSYYRLFFLIYLCDSYSNGNTISWDDFFIRFLTPFDFEKYFVSLKTDELKLFSEQYVKKYNGHVKCHMPLTTKELLEKTS